MDFCFQKLLSVRSWEIYNEDFVKARETNYEILLNNVNAVLGLNSATINCCILKMGSILV